MSHFTQIKASAKVAMQLPEIFVVERGKSLQVQQTACLLGACGETKGETANLWALQATKFSPAAHPAFVETGAVPSLQQVKIFPQGLS